MARINIEDSLYKDNRFIKLCIVLGSRRTALGALMEAYILAQSFCEADNPKCLIPKIAWECQDICPELLTVGLAQPEGDSIYIRGAEDQFKWLVQRKKAASGGGKALAEKRRNEINELDMPTGTDPASSRCPPSLTLSQEESKKHKPPSIQGGSGGNGFMCPFSQHDARERIAKIYPNMLGWSAAWNQILRKRFETNPGHLEELERAAKNYRAHVTKTNRPKDKTLQINSFVVDHWKDFLEPLKEFAPVRQTEARVVQKRKDETPHALKPISEILAENPALAAARKKLGL